MFLCHDVGLRAEANRLMSEMETLVNQESDRADALTQELSSVRSSLADLTVRSEREAIVAAEEIAVAQRRIEALVAHCDSVSAQLEAITDVRVCVCMCLCVLCCIYIYIYIYICVCMRVCMCVCICLCMLACMPVYACMQQSVRAHV